MSVVMERHFRCPRCGDKREIITEDRLLTQRCYWCRVEMTDLGLLVWDEPDHIYTKPEPEDHDTYYPRHASA